MLLQLLHLDDALKTQSDFIAASLKKNACEIDMDASDIRLWGNEKNIHALAEKLKKTIRLNGKPAVTFMGSGDFHHVTSLLLECILPEKSKITVIHFDNHPDWVHHKNGVHCGSWVNRANSLPQIEKIITIGVCSNDLKFPEFKGGNLQAMRQGKLEIYPYFHGDTRVFGQYGKGRGYNQHGRKIQWKNIEAQTADEFIAETLESVSSTEVYITIDKDVLTHDDAITNWDQGRMRLPFLLQFLKKIMEKKNILGIDVTGDYSAPRYTGPWLTRFKKHIEIKLDQPRLAYDAATIARRNASSNLALLNLFNECL